MRSPTAGAVCLALAVSLLAASPAAGGETVRERSEAPSSAVFAPSDDVRVAGAVEAAGVRAAKAKKRVTIKNSRCTLFPESNVWNTPVTHLPVHKRDKAWRAAIGSRNLHPDFGPAGRGEYPYGIPVTVVKKSATKSKVRFAYAAESDRVKYPVSSRTKIEGGKNGTGDRHAIIVQKGTCKVYELFDLRRSGSRWTAGSGAVWSLKKNKLRKDGWTSADAAGLSILAGLLRYDEVKAGRVEHAIRFTAPVTAAKHIWPARHHAGSGSSKTRPPMGARFRLKKNFSTKGFSRDAKVVVKAMKKYGIILADNGSGWFFQGEATGKWSSRMISDLKRIPSSAFEAVDTSSMRISRNSAKARQP